MATAFPPHRHHTTSRISRSEALSLLSAFLHQTATDPSLHPNALLTEDGPITPSVGASTGLVLHNLERLEAGLRGEHLGADLSLANGDGTKDLNGVPEVNGTGENGALRDAENDKVMEMDWQDLGEFEREQEVVQGEIGPRNSAVVDGAKASELKKVKSGGCDDKEARKKAKKERRKQQLREAEERRKREADAEH